MALVKKIRAAQVPLVAEFIINMADTMANTSSGVQGLNANGAFDFADLPPGVQVIGGEAITETALSGGGVTAATIALGDSAKMAQSRAYEMLDGIQFDGMQFRRDIGWRAIKK